jgi:hypothetical protein
MLSDFTCQGWFVMFLFLFLFWWEEIGGKGARVFDVRNAVEDWAFSLGRAVAATLALASWTPKSAAQALEFILGR